MVYSWVIAKSVIQVFLFIFALISVLQLSISRLNDTLTLCLGLDIYVKWNITEWDDANLQHCKINFVKQLATL